MRSRAPVRNVSKTGAALGVTSPIGIPDKFTLVLEMETVVLSCEVVWRKENTIGVRFISDAPR
ncbi:PilZ domain-containing protein [Tardiphaga sp. vice304]|uniref:PilZ domain-containing protein n=1 Tax=Tardiphaga sp. vice304 TaxID=2592817 RepID=UPI003F8E6980